MDGTDIVGKKPIFWLQVFWFVPSFYTFFASFFGFFQGLFMVFSLMKIII